MKLMLETLLETPFLRGMNKKWAKSYPEKMHLFCRYKIESKALLVLQWNPFLEATLTRGQPLWKGHSIKCKSKHNNTSRSSINRAPWLSLHVKVEHHFFQLLSLII